MLRCDAEGSEVIQIAATLRLDVWSEVASGCRAEVSPVVAGLSFHQILVLQHCNITHQQ